MSSLCLPVLRHGDHGDWVWWLQTFLLGRGHYKGAVDGDFGPKTERAVRAFQRENLLQVDGIVGNETWGTAMALGFEAAKSPSWDRARRNSPLWPPKPNSFGKGSLRPYKDFERHKAFGYIEYEPAPTARNPERIRITNGWQREHLTRVVIPQFKALAEPGNGFPKSGRVFLHKAAVEPFSAWLQEIEDQGLLSLLRTFAGSWSARFIRGSRSTLSNHSWGTAMDLNAYPWNALGARPALAGEPGSVRELAALGPKYGIYWGGWYSGRPDGMHFELGRKA